MDSREQEEIEDGKASEDQALKNEGEEKYVKSIKEKEKILKQVHFEEEQVDEKGDKELQVVKVEVDNVVRKIMVVEEDTPEKKPSAGSIDEV